MNTCLHELNLDCLQENEKEDAEERAARAAAEEEKKVDLRVTRAVSVCISMSVCTRWRDGAFEHEGRLPLCPSLCVYLCLPAGRPACMSVSLPV